MKHLIIILLLSFGLTGCSILPRITTDSPNTVPQSVDKGKSKAICKGETKLAEDGTILYCERGYYLYTEGYEKKERSYTLSEKVGNFFRSLKVWGFWGIVLLIILVPGFAGVLIGRIFNGIGYAFDETVRAIKRFRRESSIEEKEKLDNYLRAEQSKGTKKLISKKRVEK